MGEAHPSVGDGAVFLNALLEDLPVELSGERGADDRDGQREDEDAEEPSQVSNPVKPMLY